MNGEGDPVLGNVGAGDARQKHAIQDGVVSSSFFLMIRFGSIAL